MSPIEFLLSAYKALPKAERAEFLARLVQNRDVREDLMDMAAFATRKSEKSRPFADYLAHHPARR